MQTDIRTEHFLFRMTPAVCHPYMILARVDRPIGTWLLLLPCLWSLALAPGGFRYIDIGHVLLFGLGALLMRAAGCTVNDLWDRRLDAAVARTRGRPLASGALKPWQALAFLTALLLASLVILLQLNDVTVVLGILSLFLVGLYPLMKRWTWWPQLFLGFTFNWGALMGWTATTGHLEAPAVLLYIGGIFWTLAYDTIYAHQDKEDDALIGIRSTARLFGRRSKLFVGAFFGIALLFFAAAEYVAGGRPFLIILPGLHAMWQLRRWDMDDPGNCLKIFRSNRVFGLLLLLMFGLLL